MGTIRVDTLFRRGRDILQEEGIVPFIQAALMFLKGFFSFSYNTYYIYENDLNGPRFMPKVQNVSLEILYTAQGFDELVNNGFTFSSWDIDDLKNKTRRGAIAFCVFVNRNLAHRTYVGLSEEARNGAAPFPLAIDWRNETWSGFSRTHPNYQRMGLFLYVYSEIFAFLRERGISKDKFTIEKNNIASNSALLKMDSKIIGEGRRFKFLGCILWEEKLAEKTHVYKWQNRFTM
jgi:hypothetical protein